MDSPGLGLVPDQEAAHGIAVLVLGVCQDPEAGLVEEAVREASLPVAVDLQDTAKAQGVLTAETANLITGLSLDLVHGLGIGMVKI